ncbi:MOSC domain-containing protein [Candidatus Daviesbacteria bacterium]|nr:MOSC domain-containing protein [Candidatus Daviesbacteria bacterium]
MLEARVIDIQIQPLKGGGPLKFSAARMTRAGLEDVDGVIQDHFLAPVTREQDDHGFHNFLTQRVQVNPAKNLFVPGSPRLALVRPNISDFGCYFTFDGQSEIEDRGLAEDDLSRVIPVQIWEYRGGAIEVPDLSEWLSDNLKRNVLVARTSGPWNRMAKQNFMRNNNPLRAQDGYPVHTVSSNDTKAVFGAIKAEDDPNRFRYQVLLEFPGGTPFRAIHDYAEGEINGVRVFQPKACDRCEVTGIDQQTGEFSGIKPLAGIVQAGGTRWIRPDNGNKVHIMGENWLPQGKTIIRVGDTFTFTKLRETPLQFEEPKKVL